jgi:hypothetical protein
MKKAIALVVLLAVSAMANDLTGKWSGTFKADGADHTVPQLFIFKQEGGRLTGTGGPDAGEQYPIENGRVDDDHVKFELTTGEWKFAYDLRQTERDILKGNIELKSINNSRTAKVSLSKTTQNK